MPKHLAHFNMATFVLYRDAKCLTMKEGDMDISKISRTFQVSLVIGVVLPVYSIPSVQQLFLLRTSKCVNSVILENYVFYVIHTRR